MKNFQTSPFSASPNAGKFRVHPSVVAESRRRAGVPEAAPEVSQDAPVAPQVIAPELSPVVTAEPSAQSEEHVYEPDHVETADEYARRTAENAARAAEAAGTDHTTTNVFLGHIAAQNVYEGPNHFKTFNG